MRLLVLLLCAACSSTTSEPSGTNVDAASPADASTQDSSSADDAAMATDSSDASQAPNTGQCAACTAKTDAMGGCLDELQACAGSASCPTNLMTFNNCLTSHGTACGTAFAAGGSSETTLWKCLSTHCAAVCGTN
jgi:hypothetical protein